MSSPLDIDFLSSLVKYSRSFPRVICNTLKVQGFF